MEHRIQRVGILDADNEISHDLQHWLLQRGYLADIMQDARSMVNYCRQLKPAAVIMDMSLSGTDGPDLVQRLRETGYSAPIIATMEGHDDQLQVETLQMGADDFLQKPVEIRLLLERLELILRQNANPESGETLTTAELLEDVLTAMEKRILAVLQDHMPEPLSRERIMWEIKRQRISPDDRSIDVYISNIRRKLRLVRADLSIETIRGVGFALSREAVA